MSLLSLKTELRQELKLTPQLLQSMEVLQMNSQELLEYLNRLSEENPVLDQEENPALRVAFEELRHRVSWLDNAGGPTFIHEESIPEQGRTDRETEGLCAFLLDQLDRRHLAKPLLALTKYMAELVDEDGYLTDEDLETLSDLHIPQPMIQQGLEILQSLEPAGVGARTLSECLLLQLARKPGVPPAVTEIVSRFLPELGKRHYGPISRELGITAEEIQEAEGIISTLEPHPGRIFQPEESVIYIRPDIFIAELDEGLQVVLNEYYLPHISINSYYQQLLKDSGETDTQAYLRQKIQQAKWLLDSLERRNATLRLCADAILESQQAFFAGRTDTLAPMSITSLAAQLQLHPSTVSRAIRGKYLQCRQGTYPMRYFFSRAVSTLGPSRQAVKQHLLKLIKQENSLRPLSDQTLCRLLCRDGMEVSRRTVTKYRLELGIPSSAVRKQR